MKIMISMLFVTSMVGSGLSVGHEIRLGESWCVDLTRFPRICSVGYALGHIESI